MRLLRGYVILYYTETMAEKVINALREAKYDSWGYHKEEEIFSICTTRNGAKFLENMQEGLYIRREDYGVVPWLMKHRNRAGLGVGLFLSALIFSLSFSVVWDVRVEGNEHVSSEQIRGDLEALGLRVGATVNRIDKNALSNHALIGSSYLSFLQVNMRGCVAYVTVRERDVGEEMESREDFGNLVASEDAVIESLSVSRGEPKVHAGQVVRAGDLLVSGVTEGLSGSRLTEARGEVLGRLQKHLSVTVPAVVMQECEEKTYLQEISLVFLGKTINIYRNTGNLPDKYVTIYENSMACVGDDLCLPFGLVRATAVSYVPTPRELAPEEQVALATRRLMEEIQTTLLQGELISKHMYGSFTENGYILHCDIEYVTNIAIPQKIVPPMEEK